MPYQGAVQSLWAYDVLCASTSVDHSSQTTRRSVSTEAETWSFPLLLYRNITFGHGQCLLRRYSQRTSDVPQQMVWVGIFESRRHIILKKQQVVLVKAILKRNTSIVYMCQTCQVVDSVAIYLRDVQMKYTHVNSPKASRPIPNHHAPRYPSRISWPLWFTFDSIVPAMPKQSEML